MKSKDYLLNDPVPELVRKLSIPASIGFFFNTMYNVIDVWFGGLISTDVLASLSISFPIFFVIIAVSSGMGTGTTVLIANALGSGRSERAAEYCIQAILLGASVALGITIFGWIASPRLFELLGASGEYLVTALAYINVIFLGTIFFVIINVLNAPLTAIGDTKSFRNTLIAGCLLNILLDPWFIFGGLGVPALGFRGIALATIIIEALGCVYIGYKASKTGLITVSGIHALRPRRQIIMELLKHIVPACFNMLMIGIGIFLITYYVSRFGKDAVAAYGIAIRIEQIALLPILGLNMATLAIVGQNYGGKNYSRLIKAVTTSLKYGFCVMSITGGAVFLLAPELMRLFTDSTDIIVIGSQYLRIATLTVWAYVILFILTSTLQGIENPMYVIWIGLYRQIIAPILLFEFLTRVLDWRLGGIWWGIFIVTWSAAIWTGFYTWRKLYSKQYDF